MDYQPPHRPLLPHRSCAARCDSNHSASIGRAHGSSECSECSECLQRLSARHERGPWRLCFFSFPPPTFLSSAAYPLLTLSHLTHSLLACSLLACSLSLAVCLSFFLAYQTPVSRGGYYVVNRRRIIHSYLTGWFLIDFLSILPIWVVTLDYSNPWVYSPESLAEFTAAANSTDAGSPSPSLSRVIRLFRMLKLARVLKASRVLQRNLLDVTSQTHTRACRTSAVACACIAPFGGRSRCLPLRGYTHTLPLTQSHAPLPQLTRMSHTCVSHTRFSHALARALRC